MRVLTNAEVLKNFTEQNPIFAGVDYCQGDEHGLFYIHPEASCIVVEYPRELERLPFFARHIATLGYEPWHFTGALLWMHQFGIWDEALEGIGYRIVEQMNRAAGQPSAFEVSKGHEFRADELTDAVGMLLQPMIFGWDSFYLPRWSWGTGEFFIHISHDSYVVVVTKTKAFHEQALAELTKLNYTVRAVSEHEIARFCRHAAV
jgi:hypothetical protein